MEGRDKIIKPEMKLYTAVAPSIVKRFATEVGLNELVKEGSKGVYIYGGPTGSPGVIVENSRGGHNIYGLHSMHREGLTVCMGDVFGSTDNLLYGEGISSPEELLRHLGRGKYIDKIVSGCVISMGAFRMDGRKDDWGIFVHPDHDLKDRYPEKFDDSLVNSLNKTVSDYIKDYGLSDKVKSFVCPGTLKLGGSEFHLAFYEHLK